MSELINQTPKRMRDSIAQSLDTIIADSLRRTQLLLQPILVLVSPDLAVFAAPTDKAQTQAQSHSVVRGGGAKWLRFGPPANQLAFPKLPLLEDEMSDGVAAAGAADGASGADGADGADGVDGADGKDEARKQDKAQGADTNSAPTHKASSKMAKPAIREISDFRSPIAVAKPGKRFNLLSMTS